MLREPMLREQGHLLTALYNEEMAQGWERGVLAVSDTLLANQIPTNGQILEIGCGGGTFLRHWQQRHSQQRLVGIDLHPSALLQAQVFNQTATHDSIGLSRTDLTQLPFASNTFDALVAFDVFDQVAVTLADGLSEAQRVLKPGGLLLLRVSAYRWLYGKHDIAFGTGRRYERHELRQSIEHVGLHLQRMTSANTLLASPIIAQRLLQNWGLLAFDEGIYTSPVINRLVAQALRIESALLHHLDLPFGLSLYALARKDTK